MAKADSSGDGIYNLRIEEFDFRRRVYDLFGPTASVRRAPKWEFGP